MKKKLVSLILTLAMVTSLFSGMTITANAETYARSVMVFGEWSNPLTNKDCFFTEDGEFVEAEEEEDKPEDGYIHYDPSTGILTLNNFEFEAGSKKAIELSDGPVIIHVVGENVLTCTYANGIDDGYNGANTQLTIKGVGDDASLTINSKNSGIFANARTVTIEDVDLTINARDKGITANRITITNSKINITADDYYSIEAVDSSGDGGTISISGAESEVTLKSKGEYAWALNYPEENKFTTRDGLSVIASETIDGNFEKHVWSKNNKYKHVKVGYGLEPEQPSIEDLSQYVAVDTTNHTYTVNIPDGMPYDIMILEGRNTDEDEWATSYNEVKGQKSLQEVTKEDCFTPFALSLSGTPEPTGRLWEGQTLVLFTYNPDISYNLFPQNPYPSYYYAVTGIHAVPFSTDKYVKDMSTAYAVDNGVMTIAAPEDSLFYIFSRRDVSDYMYDASGYPVLTPARMEADNSWESTPRRYYEADYTNGTSDEWDPFDLGGSIQYAPGDIDAYITNMIVAQGGEPTSETIAYYKTRLAPLTILEMSKEAYVEPYNSGDYHGEFRYHPLTGVYKDSHTGTYENTRPKIEYLEDVLVQKDVLDVKFHPEAGKTYIVMALNTGSAMTPEQLKLLGPVGMTPLDQVTGNQLAFEEIYSQLTQIPMKVAYMPETVPEGVYYELVTGDETTAKDGIQIPTEGKSKLILVYEINPAAKYTLAEAASISRQHSPLSAGDYYPVVGFGAVSAYKPVITITDYKASVEVEQGNIDEELRLYLWTRTPTANYQWFRCDADGNEIEAVPAENILGDSFSSESVSAVRLALDLANSPAGTYYYICKITAEGADPVTSEVMTVTVKGDESGEHEHKYEYTSNNNNGTHNGACACGKDAITNEACTYGDDGKCTKCGYAKPSEEPDHEHEYTYESKNNGTHSVTCKNCDEAATNEDCTYGDDGKCTKCGYAKPSEEPDHEHEYTYKSNDNGTHNGACECGEDAIENEPCTYVDSKCEKCGYEKTYTISGNVTIKGEKTPIPNAKVELKKGNTVVAEDTTDASGNYDFANVPKGGYNIVVTTSDSGKTKTSHVKIENSDQTVDVEFPKGNVSSKVEVKENTDNDATEETKLNISETVAEGVDTIAEQYESALDSSKHVEVKLEVEPMADLSQADDSSLSEEQKEIKQEQSEIKNLAAEESNGTSDNEKKIEFLDLSLWMTETVDGVKQEAQNIGDNNNVILSIIIPFDTSAEGIVIYRCHNGVTEAMTNMTRNLQDRQEGFVIGVGEIIIYARQFSTYAVGYDVEDAETPNEPEIPGTYDVTVTIKERNTNDTYVICDDAEVTLISLTGEKQTKTQSIGNGVYTFKNVANGIYNLKIKNGDKIKTILVKVEGANVDLGDIFLPAMKVNSQVEVNVKGPIKGALVGGLDGLADQRAGSVVINPGDDVTIDVDMTINTQMSNDVDFDERIAIETIAQDQSENLTFLDIKIDQTITTIRNGVSDNGKTTSIKDTVDLLEIVIPFETANRDSFALYRYHELDNSVVQKLVESDDVTKERIVVDKNNDTITMYVRYFSTYAIGYSVDTPTPPSVSGGGSGSSGTAYTVNSSVNTVGGKVVTSVKAAAYGEKVTITVTPDDGYELKTIAVTDANGNAVKLTSLGNGKYTFEMPKSKVTVNTSFRKQAVDCPRDVTCPIHPYTDASTTAWYHDGVHYCVEKGLMSGYGNNIFKPDEGTTRAMLAVMLWRLNGSPAAVNAPEITDVKDGQWYTEAVRWAAANGVMAGYGNGEFGPDDILTREQMVTILYSYAKLKGIDVSAGEETNILSYEDAFDVEQWAVSAMQWACGEGVVSGIAKDNGMNLMPQGSTTRAQIATMMLRFCTEILKV